MLPACSIAAAFVALMRFRRSRGDERLQMKWFVTAALIGALVYASDSIVRAHKPELTGMADTIGTLSAVIVPSTVAVAILKFRLWDIDVFISKTVVFAAMGVFITVVYVGIVVGIGAALGNAGSRPSVALSIFATAVVAVGFQPVLERAKRFGNRLVYGKRATPYEVLAEFSDRLGRTYATEDVLLNMARTIAEGIGARRANVWLRNASELRLAASWPVQASVHEPPLVLVHDRLPALPGVDRAVPVRHQDKLLGAITIVKPPAEPLSSTEDKLLDDLASQAGLVLRNVRLTAELVDRLEELTASRQRLIAAQDEARRRLERNIHDGAQQHLVALKVRLGMAKRLAADNARLKEALETLQLQADEALEALRDTAHGIYPPLLAERGLGVALKSQVRRFEVPVDIYTDDLERYPEDIEAAVYFCCLEALQNVAKYAEAHGVTLRVGERDGLLHFTVEDDGIGFDRESTPPGAGLMNMADRLAALGGTLEIRSALGAGTCVIGELPTEARLQPGIASLPELARA
jgi:signal transduction histidine kinase